jgi:hypothetical protein
MQVQSFVPFRTIVALPLASIVTIDALWAIDAGAADSALFTGSLEAASLLFEEAEAELSEAMLFSLVLAALLHAPMAIIDPASSSTPVVLIAMGPSFDAQEGRTI